MTDEAPTYAWQWDAARGREVYRRVRTEEPPRRGWGPRINFLRDDCDVVSMVDGKRYTSKSALRASYKAHGYVEVGDQTDYVSRPVEPKEPEGVAESVDMALEKTGLK